VRFQQQSVLIVNLVGGALACVLAVAGVWQTVLRPNTASAELRESKLTLADKTRDLAVLRHELDNQSELLEGCQATLTTAGARPERTPIEDNLRTITDLARRNDIELTEVTPLVTASYPGILETRYRVRGRGAYVNLANTLRQFEACDFWGDITHLHIDGSSRAAETGTYARELELTVSFYSVAESESAETR